MVNAPYVKTSCVFCSIVLLALGVFAELAQGQQQPVEAMPAHWFPILPWGRMLVGNGTEAAQQHGLPSMAQCNFTLAGFVQPEDLPECERLGLMAIVAPPKGRPWFARGKQFDAAQVEEMIRRRIDEAGPSKAIVGYYIMDEPGAPEFPMLAHAVAAVKKYAPGKLAYINLFPGYATTGAPGKSQLGTATFSEYLERFVAEVKPQLLSYDNYMVQYSHDLVDRAKAARYYLDLMEVRRVALEHNLTFWNIVASNQIRPAATPPSVPNLFFQAYTTLAAGGRGVSWYTYYQHSYRYAPIDGQGRRTETWSYLQLVNHHLRVLGPVMNQLRSTGVYYTDPPPVESLPLLPGKLVESVEAVSSADPQFAVPLPAMVGEFADGAGEHYVMIVNLSLERSANVRIKTIEQYSAKEVFSAEDGHRLPLDEKNGHWLLPGQGLLIHLRK